MQIQKKIQKKDWIKEYAEKEAKCIIKNRRGGIKIKDLEKRAIYKFWGITNKEKSVAYKYWGLKNKERL